MTTIRLQQRGFSLVEALVALLIIAVGLLGIAGMQALSLNSTSNSRVRALAAVEASNMAAYMAANATFWRNVPSGFSVTVTPVGAPFGASATLSTTNAALSSDFSNATDCAQVQCTPSQMAAYDLRQWGTNQNPQLALLPQAVGNIGYSSTGVLIVSVGWTEQHKEGSALGSSTTSYLAPSTTWYRIVVQP